MIGILIISHSAAIARGVKELAEQMVHGRVPIAAAGGTHDGQLGTSIDLISSALDELHNADAVLTLVDMGSAVMSAEMALELSGRNFLITGAPLVEGALVAAVEAMRPDATLEQVAAVAVRALEGKGLGTAPDGVVPPVEEEPPVPPPAATSTAEVTLTVTNKVGLHMRPAKEFVQTAMRFPCTLRVRNLDRPERPDGNAKSMIDVMKIGVSSGQRIQIQASGDESTAAIEALTRLVINNFGEH
jgi:dihydroxyacetone kinase phosphotransfer subunit